MQEGADVSESLIGNFSSWARAMNALAKWDLGRMVLLGYFVEEVLLDSPWQWSLLLPKNYHRTWIMSAPDKIERSTPGIDELLEHGIEQTVRAFKLGDVVAYNAGGTLRAGVVCGVPHRSHPEPLREVMRNKPCDGVDITDEYLWYSVLPFPSRPYSDVQLVQTEMFPVEIALSKPRKRSLARLRAELLGQR